MESRVLLLIVALCVPYSLCQIPDKEIKLDENGNPTGFSKTDIIKGWIFHRNETRCYQPIGCLTTTQDWYSITRPFNPFPASREAVGTNFMLYTRENRAGKPLKVDENEDVPSENFKSDRDTKIVIHGFHEKGSAEVYTRIVEAFLNRMDVNVVIVDWAKGASGLYTFATANSRLVALEVAYLINALIKKRGASAGKFHLIGHGLGAHASGYAGENISNLGRITGLDPAGPYFRGMPSFVRLDRSDAVLVDTIHTDSFMGFGTTEDPLGDLEFYPNGGQHQPGCLLISSEISLEDFPLCSHRRSVELFLESIVSSPFYPGSSEGKCPFISFKCESYKYFLEGKCLSCGEDGLYCPLMGLDADKYPGINPKMERQKFFLKTGSDAPFCGYHYRFNLTMAKKYDGPDKVVGDLKVTATGEGGVTADMPLTSEGTLTLKKGETYSLLGFSNIQTGKVTTAGVEWDWSPNSLINRICILCRKNLQVSDAAVTNMGYYPPDKFKTSMSCKSSDAKKIENGGRYNFQLTC